MRLLATTKPKHLIEMTKAFFEATNITGEVQLILTEAEQWSSEELPYPGNGMRENDPVALEQYHHNLKLPEAIEALLV